MAATTEQKVIEIRRDDKNVAVVNLHGATLVSWIQDGTEMIFVSKKAVFDNKKAIRGGIPVVFPCFGPWDLGPQHGFARTSSWSVCQEPKLDGDRNGVASFELRDNETTRSMWNNKFSLVYTVTIKSDSLTTELSVKNLNDNDAFSFTWLLHTYFLTPDVTQIGISGLSGLTYIDKVDGGKEKQEMNDPIAITGFTDRVYKGAKKDHMITNVSGNKTICLKKSGFPDTVVWNPWSEKAKAMGDFGDDEYPTMVCVEAGYVAEPYTLAAGASYSASQTLQAGLKNKF